jgi:hypothetical protein
MLLEISGEITSESTEDLYKKDLQDSGNQDGVITHLEPDILECEVKWALGKCTHMPTNMENSSVAKDWNKSVFISNPKKGNTKECSNYLTIAPTSHASKVILKILQARLQQYVNCEISDVQAALRTGRGTRDQIANIHWIIEKEREFQEIYIFLLYWLC